MRRKEEKRDITFPLIADAWPYNGQGISAETAEIRRQLAAESEKTRRTIRNLQRKLEEEECLWRKPRFGS